MIIIKREQLCHNRWSEIHAELGHSSKMELDIFLLICPLSTLRLKNLYRRYRMKKIVFILLTLIVVMGLFATERGEVTVGTGTEQGRVPVNMFYKNSLFQCIYYPSELGVNDVNITGLRFYNDFNTNIENKPTQIWMGITALENLSTGWIPSSQLTMVFNGDVDYPDDVNPIDIELDTPFSYAGGNLLLFVYRPFDTNYYTPSEYFSVQTIGSNRARTESSDTVALSPLNPPTANSSQLSGTFPKTTFVYNHGGLGSITGTVYHNTSPLEGATVSITSTAFTTTSAADGTYSFVDVPMGNYQVRASKTGFIQQVLSADVLDGETTVLNFNLIENEIVFSDGFELYPNFALTFAPWTLVDVDLSGTYGVTGYTWESIYSPMAYTIFNPSATTPPLATGAAAHAGSKYAASFASTDNANNDWMISPMVMGGGGFSFWARSYVSTYGLERFRVGVSTTNTEVASFNIISGDSYIQAPIEWTLYNYSLEAYDGQMVYVAIQCVSDDAFFFMVDDVVLMGTVDNNDNSSPIVHNLLLGNYPNPFNPETTIRFSLQERSEVKLSIYNSRGQLVRNLIDESRSPGTHNVLWNGKDDNGRSVSSGVYFYKIRAGKFSSSKKMILMK